MGRVADDVDEGFFQCSTLRRAPVRRPYDAVLLPGFGDGQTVWGGSAQPGK